jgi:hypothetical protein
MYLNGVSMFAAKLCTCYKCAYIVPYTRALSAYSGAVGSAHISHLKAGRVQLEFIEQVEGRRHDLAWASVVGLLDVVLIARLCVDLRQDSTPCNDI